MGKVLFVVTSNDKLGAEGKPTGAWYEEIAAPYNLLKAAGHEITIASPLGGKTPIDANSMADGFFTDACKAFQGDAEAVKKLDGCVKLSECKVGDFDAIMYPGGHGPYGDLVDDAASIALLAGFYSAGKPTGLVCHGPVALKNVKDASGVPIIKGKKVTGFSNAEEEAVGLTKVVPFLLEDMLKESGAEYSSTPNLWHPHCVTDGNLITGQNPGSSHAVGEALQKLLAE